MAGLFIQIGGTRDGSDPYLRPAQRRGWRSALVETPEFFSWRERQGWPVWDHQLAVESPCHPEPVITAVSDLYARTGMQLVVLAGFETCVTAAHAAARACNIGFPFISPNKYLQRCLLKEQAPQIGQPRFQFAPMAADIVEAAALIPPPLVVKPVDAGGGLGVEIVNSHSESPLVARRLAELTNYGGGSFDGFIVEEIVNGIEISLQGLVINGIPEIMSTCRKLTYRARDVLGCNGFREAGHVALAGNDKGWEVEFARSCCCAFNYRQGPFHIDIILTPHGPVFLEMGFRLSGMGVVTISDRVSGRNWADEVFGLSTRVECPPSLTKGDRPIAAGRCALRDQEQVKRATIAIKHSNNLTLKLQRSISPDHILFPELTSDLARHGDVLAVIEGEAVCADSLWSQLASIAGIIPSQQKVSPCAE